MPEMMNITVRNKIATKTDNVAYVCGNSDYVINFDFDSEWDAYDTKTARFAHDGQHTDVVFAGNQCNVPIITNTYAFHVGVFAGDLHTTTAARVPCRKSILCGSGAPANPTPDVYDQLMERMAQLEAPDWDQNDPTAKDYIKNRPFYSTVGEGVIATGARGIMNASQFGQEPIPKVRINDVIYTNVASTGIEGTYYVFEFPPYTVKVNPMYFYINILEGSAPATISEDDIEILGETTIYTPIPDQYLPDSVATKADVVQSDWSQSNEKAKDFIKNKPSVITRHNVNFVTPLSISAGIANINTPSFTYSDVAVVAGSSLTEKISFKKVATSVVTAEIYSCKTGKPITDDELPYGYIVITRFRLLPDNTTRIVYCLNPV